MMKTAGDRAFTSDSLYGVVNEATYAGALSFLRRNYTRDLTGVDVVVTGIPYDLATTNRPGTRFGPAGIRRASVNLSWGPTWPWGFTPVDRLAIIDYGDCPFDFGRPEGVPDEIEAHASKIIEQGPKLFSMGGDHFITYPLLKAHAKEHGPLSLIHFDAHSDTWRDEDGRIDHGTMFFHAAMQGIVDPSRSIQLGMRTHNDETHGFTVHDARWVLSRGPEAVAEEIKRVVGDHKAYLTFDIDFLDPSCAPGTGTPVIGGPTTAMAQEILRRLDGIDIVGMDLVEVAPQYDIADVTSLAGATMMTEVLCLLSKDLPSKV